MRANQGHSIPVDVELEEKESPEILYHGTGQKYVESINAHGLIPKNRLYVHLSKSKAGTEIRMYIRLMPGKCTEHGTSSIYPKTVCG